MKKIFSLKKRIRAVSGGTGASKTISILVWCIDYAQSTRNELVSVVSESYPHLEKGAMLDFRQIMADRGYWREERWNASKHQYTFETGTILEFFSSDYGKAHGPRRDVLFVNEAQNLDWITVDQLITRTRKIVWLDWNPTNEFWFYTEMWGRRDDIEFIGAGGTHPPLTYLDNEALDDVSRNEILAHRGNPRWWKVYGLGELGDPEGRIYTGWQILSEIPHEARLERYGLDFGYNPDPAAIVAVYYYNGGYVLDEILYATRMDNNATASVLRNLPYALVVADSASPLSIAELKSLGVNVVGTPKPKESKRYGIKAVQSQKISVTARSVNILREYRNYYQYRDPKTNLFIVGETEGEDHALDAARYALCSLLPMIARREYLQAIPNSNLPKKRNLV